MDARADIEPGFCGGNGMGDRLNPGSNFSATDECGSAVVPDSGNQVGRGFHMVADAPLLVVRTAAVDVFQCASVVIQPG